MRTPRVPGRATPWPHLAAVVCLLAQGEAGAQIPEFNQLRTPESPAFVVLGIAPSQVSRPNTPATFATSLLENFRDRGGLGLPKSFALETTPYWWFAHPALTLDEYQRASAASLIRNLSVSVAVTDSADGDRDATGLRRIGLGLRTSAVAGQTADSRCISDIEQAAVAVSALVGASIAEAIVADPGLAADEVRLERLRGEAYEQAVDRLPEEQKRRLRAETNACVRRLSARRGFVLDLASAVALRFPNGAAGDGRASSLGIWATPAFTGSAWSAAGVARLAWNRLETDTTETAFDLGTRGTYARDRFAVSVETVWRRVGRASSSDTRFRLVGTFDVQVAGDTWLTLSFGRDYEADEPGSLIALANLQFQLGSRSVRPRL